MKFRLHGFFHDLPPGPTRFPHLSVEMGKQLYANPLGTLMGYYQEYGPVFTLRFFGQEIVFMVSPEANQKILVESVGDFSWGEGLYAELIPFLGHGLLTTDDGDHDRARELLAPAFYPAQIASYGDKMVQRAREAIDGLEANDEVELHEWVRGVALEIAGDVLLGMETPKEQAQELAYHFEEGLGCYDGYFWQTLFLRGPGTKHATLKRHGEELDRLIYAEIERRRSRPRGGEAIFDRLCDANAGGERFRPREIRDHLVTLLFAGHDTTAATVSWMMSQLGQHREVYRRLEEEVDQVVGQDDPRAAVLFDDMEYLDQVFKETLRLFPPAWFGPRRSRREFSIHGHRIPADTHVTYCSWMTHRLPELYEHPDAFWPERFRRDRYRALKPGAYVPFGRGPRTCIGMRFGELEAKILVVLLMQRYELELSPGQDFRVQTIPTISPREGVRVRLKQR